MYLVMTRFSRRSIRDVFRNRDKLIIFRLATVLITSGLTFAEGIMTEKCLLGSVGGGCGEQEVITEARRVLVTGESDVIDLDMTNEVAENNGMVCGGTMKVLINVIEDQGQ